MVRTKFLPGRSSTRKSEISLIYQSATESTFTTGLSSSRPGQPERNATPEQKPPKPQKTLKLGGGVSARVCRNRVARLQCFLRVPSSLICKMKEQYAVWKDGARCANIRITDLFVGNQLLMHVNATPVNGRRKQQLRPSVGFVNRVQAPAGHREMRER